MWSVSDATARCWSTRGSSWTVFTFTVSRRKRVLSARRRSIWSRVWRAGGEEMWDYFVVVGNPIRHYERVEPRLRPCSPVFCQRSMHNDLLGSRRRCAQCSRRFVCRGLLRTWLKNCSGTTTTFVYKNSFIVDCESWHNFVWSAPGQVPPRRSTALHVATSTESTSIQFLPVWKR